MLCYAMLCDMYASRSRRVITFFLLFFITTRGPRRFRCFRVELAGRTSAWSANARSCRSDASSGAATIRRAHLGVRAMRTHTRAMSSHERAASPRRSLSAAGVKVSKLGHAERHRANICTDVAWAVYESHESLLLLVRITLNQVFSSRNSFRCRRRTRFLFTFVTPCPRR